MTSAAISEFESAERRLFEVYGLEVESRFLELRDPPMRARVLETGEGAPVVLVHGGGGVGATWAPLMAKMSGARLVVVDRPGFGLSDGFDYRGVDLRRHAVAFLESLLDALGIERAAFVGNSMGGLWSFWLALDRPERVSTLAQLGSTALLMGTMAPLPMRLLSVPGLNRLMLAAEKPSPEQARTFLVRLGHDEAVIDRRLSRRILRDGRRLPKAPRLRHGMVDPRGALPHAAGCSPGCSFRRTGVAARATADPLCLGRWRRLRRPRDR